MRVDFASIVMLGSTLFVACGPATKTPASDMVDAAIRPDVDPLAIDGRMPPDEVASDASWPPTHPVDIALDARMSPAGACYSEPEVLSEANIVVFHDQADDSVRVSRLDPGTGLLASSAGPTEIVDVNAVPFGREAANGPELGMDRDGWSVFYAKRNENGQRQLYRGERRGSSFSVDLLTTGTEHHSHLVRKDREASDVLVIAIEGFGLDGPVVAFEDDEPSAPLRVLPERPLGTSVAFLPGTDRLLLTMAPEGTGDRQLFSFDFRGERALIQVEHDPGDKDNVDAWYAPELGANMAALAIDKHELGIYLEERPDSWVRVDSYPIPPGARGGVLRSPAPFVQDGRSYIAVGIYRDIRGTEGEIWVYDADAGTALRCDGGHPGSRVVEPEPYVTAAGTYVLYSVIDPSGCWALWRCRVTP